MTPSLSFVCWVILPKDPKNPCLVSLTSRNCMLFSSGVVTLFHQYPRFTNSYP